MSKYALFYDTSFSMTLYIKAWASNFKLFCNFGYVGKVERSWAYLFENRLDNMRNTAYEIFELRNVQERQAFISWEGPVRWKREKWAVHVEWDRNKSLILKLVPTQSVIIVPKVRIVECYKYMQRHLLKCHCKQHCNKQLLKWRRIIRSSNTVLLSHWVLHINMKYAGQILIPNTRFS